MAGFYSSCKPDETVDVNQNKIYTEYELFYNAIDGRTYVRAKFKHKKSSGTTLQLSSPSFVSFNAQPMGYNASLQQYELLFDSLITEGQFLWMDTDGRKYFNQIQLNTIGFAEVTPFERVTDKIITWNGSPLLKDESVMLFLVPENTGEARYITQNEIGSTSVAVTKEVLSQFDAGSIRISLQRTYAPPLTEKTDAGGKITGRYRSDEFITGLQ